MGNDWEDSDKFDYLKEYCEVHFLERTEGISTTKIKKDLGLQGPEEKSEKAIQKVLKKSPNI